MSSTAQTNLENPRAMPDAPRMAELAALESESRSEAGTASPILMRVGIAVPEGENVVIKLARTCSRAWSRASEGSPPWMTGCGRSRLRAQRQGDEDT